MDELPYEIETDPEDATFEETEQTAEPPVPAEALQGIENALSSLLLALGILVGLVAVLIFSGGMRNAS